MNCKTANSSFSGEIGRLRILGLKGFILKSLVNHNNLFVERLLTPPEVKACSNKH